VIAHHSIDASGDRSKATLSLRYEGLLGGFALADDARHQPSLSHHWKRMALKARSENPYFKVSS
jgi:hypothetical protein